MLETSFVETGICTEKTWRKLEDLMGMLKYDKPKQAAIVRDLISQQ